MESCDFAAGLARLYNGGSKSDWFLPSLYELRFIFVNVSDQIYVTGRFWWSSSQGGTTGTSASAIYIGGGLNNWVGDNYHKVDYNLGVRPIRAF
jgi:hypothetical protein